MMNKVEWVRIVGSVLSLLWRLYFLFDWKGL